MKKFENLLTEVLLPIASKLEANKALAAIRRAMMVLIPVTLVGSIPILFVQLPSIPGLPMWLGEMFNVLGSITQPLNLATYGFMAIYVTVFISYNYAKELEVWDIGAVIASVIGFVSMATIYGQNGPDISYFGGTGMFLAILIGLVSVKIIWYIRYKLKFTINLGDGVPQTIQKSFENLWPIFFCSLILVFAKYGIETVTALPIVKIVDILAFPLKGLVNSLPGILLILFLQNLVWLFGIHGYSIFSAIYMPVAFENANANAALFQSGASMSKLFIFTPDFIWNIAGMSGAGVTIGLVIYMMFFAKTKKNRTLGKISIIPALFGINEPILFGLPILLNPIMIIPFLMTPLIIASVSWFVFASNLVNKFVMISPYIPIPFGAVIATMDLRYLVLFIAMIIISIVIYVPFFKILEKNEISKAEVTSESNLDDLDIEL